MPKNTTVLEMNGKKYILTFGLEFLRLLNEKYTMDNNGFKLSIGLQTAISEISSGNAEMIATIIECATSTLHEKPTDEDIETYIYEALENEDEDLFEHFFDLLQKAPGAKRMLKIVDEEMQNQLNQ